MASLRMSCCLLFLVAGLAQASVGSPVQKVIELLDDCKVKIDRDLAAQEQEMSEYAAYCDKEAKEKEYSIKTSARGKTELEASITDGQATIEDLDSQIASLGNEMAAKEKELAEATGMRQDEHHAFIMTEQEMEKTVDELTNAAEELKKGMSFLQTPKASKVNKMTVQALSKIVDAAWVDSASRHVLKGFLQQAQSAASSSKEDEDDDLSMHQAAKQPKAEGGAGGGLVEVIDNMKDKAEMALTDSRQEETKASHNYNMMEAGMQQEIALLKEKKDDSSMTKETTSEEMGNSQGELGETKKTKAADEAYLATLKRDCQGSARSYELRVNDAKAELGAITKAKEILVGGVRVFVQVGTKMLSKRGSGDDDDDKTDARRTALVNKLKDMAHKYHSFAMMQMVTVAASDPFNKIRGLIEGMISKLITEANEEASQKGFCDEEMGKSTKSKDDKSMSLDKFRSRSDKASAAKTLLEESVKELEAEMADIDAGEAEATKLRSQEKSDYAVASKDFRDAAEATERAIVVLKEYYEGAGASLLQSDNKAAAKGDGAGIIAILELACEDFTKTYTELDAGEDKSQKDYEALQQQNRISRATKTQEARGKASEVKSLTVALANYKTDSDMVAKELDAVLMYLEKLKPQCESKVMSYAEKKARRAAEIDGLKEALTILEN